jgi:hypothetical protein
MIVSINHRRTAAKVTAKLNIRLEDRFLKISPIRASIAKPLITENNLKKWKIWCDDHKTWPSDDWKYI